MPAQKVISFNAVEENLFNFILFQVKFLLDDANASANIVPSLYHLSQEQFSADSISGMISAMQFVDQVNLSITWICFNWLVRRYWIVMIGTKKSCQQFLNTVDYFEEAFHWNNFLVSIYYFYINRSFIHHFLLNMYSWIIHWKINRKCRNIEHWSKIKKNWKYWSVISFDVGQCTSSSWSLSSCQWNGKSSRIRTNESTQSNGQKIFENRWKAFRRWTHFKWLESVIETMDQYSP